MAVQPVVAGFDFSTSTDDVAVTYGSIDGDNIAAVVLDVSALALGDGTHAIVYDGTTVVGQLLATALVAGEVRLGQFVEASAATTSQTFEGRGVSFDSEQEAIAVSADDTITL